MKSDIKAKVKDLFENTNMTLEEIAEAVGYKSYTYLYQECIAGQYSQEFLHQRKRKNYQRARTRNGNWMSGRTKEQHPRYLGRVSDGRGYIMVLKPEWYTGRKGSTHVFEHTIVMCEALGLTELPEGFVVHHVDGDKTNNDLKNLALMRMEAHSKLHHLM